MIPSKPYLNLVALLAMTLAIAVQLYAGGPGPRAAHFFHSYAGDVSDIRLRMNEAHSFTLEMYLVAFNDYVLMKGEWKEDQDRFELTFTQNRPTIENLFDQDMITGKHSFKIEKDQEEFFVFGTLCTRSGSAPVAQMK
jgi:hypothetical protein